MKLIVGKNDSGKTRALIEHSLETGIPVFALHESKAESFRVKSISYFGKAVKVVTLNDFIQNAYQGDVLIDDLDKVCASMLATFAKTSSFNIAGATITED